MCRHSSGYYYFINILSVRQYQFILTRAILSEWSRSTTTLGVVNIYSQSDFTKIYNKITYT